MASYDTMDEEALHKLLQSTDDMGERKKIRAKLREISTQNQLEAEERRKKREQDQEDAVRMKFRLAEENKVKKMQAFQDQAAKPTSDRLEQFQKGTQDMIHEKQRLADEDKRKTLETYDKLAGKEVKTVTTTTTSKDGKTTTVTKKSETTATQQSPGFGGMQYGKPVAAKPQGARGARAAFQGMDKANPQAPSKPNVFGAPAAAGRGGGSSGRVTRSPSAVKTMLLEWTKAMTREYIETIEIKNFGSSWNNGLAFCALIHHFYPDSFDFDKLEAKNRRYNFNLAFDTAEKVADIAPLLDTDDMVKMKTPDWKCVFCYVQSFYRKLQTHERNKAMAPPPGDEQ